MGHSSNFITKGSFGSPSYSLHFYDVSLQGYYTFVRRSGKEGGISVVFRDFTYPQYHGPGSDAWGFRANWKSAGKGGRIPRGGSWRFRKGLPGILSTGRIELKLGRLLYLVLLSSYPFSECKYSKYKWLLNVGVAVAGFW